MISGSENGNINIRYVLTSTSKSITLKGHSDAVNCLEILSNYLLASGSNDGKIIIWDMKNTLKIKQLSEDQPVRSLIFTENSYLISLSGDFTITIWSIENLNNISQLQKTNKIINIAYYNQNLFIATESYLQATQIENELFRVFFYLPNKIIFFENLKNGNFACSFFNGNILIISFNNNSNFTTKKIIDQTNSISCLSHFYDVYLAIGLKNGHIHIWDFSMSTLIKTISEHTTSILSLAYFNQGIGASSSEYGALGSF